MSAPRAAKASQRAIASSKPSAARQSVRAMTRMSRPASRDSSRALSAVRTRATAASRSTTRTPEPAWKVQRFGNCWSSMLTAAAPAAAKPWTVRRRFDAPPKPVSPSTINGTPPAAATHCRATSSISTRARMPASGSPRHAETPKPLRKSTLAPASAKTRVDSASCTPGHRTAPGACRTARSFAAALRALIALNCMAPAMTVASRMLICELLRGAPQLMSCDRRARAATTQWTSSEERAAQFA
mmetsp:Transcript_31084/g.102832  ORF Transcript_31084/g.102832 Transcript_31084/m.102832 type:complete len:243 (-) Transcript_31084:12-740(-)